MRQGCDSDSELGSDTPRPITRRTTTTASRGGEGLDAQGQDRARSVDTRRRVTRRGDARGTGKLLAGRRRGQRSGQLPVRTALRRRRGDCVRDAIVTAVARIRWRDAVPSGTLRSGAVARGVERRFGRVGRSRRLSRQTGRLTHHSRNGLHHQQRDQHGGGAAQFLSHPSWQYNPDRCSSRSSVGTFQHWRRIFRTQLARAIVLEL